LAYDASVDYRAKQNELKKQMEAETDAAKKAALQSQYDAYEQSRLEKIASDLTAYGKYASDSELNSAASIVANNQLGTTYETQKQQLQDYYAQARQNANNDAISRGMARSSYVQDRLSGLDSDLAGGLSNIDASKAAALESARANILDNYRTNAANAADAAKSDARDQVSLALNAGGSPSDELWNSAGYDPSVVAALKAAQAASAGTTGGGGGGGTNYTLSQLNGQLQDMVDNYRGAGDADALNQDMYDYILAYGGQYANQLIAQWGLGGYAPKPETEYTPIGYTQLGSFAQTLLGQGKQSGASAAQMSALISNALAQGKITEAEADLIISSFGY